MIRILCALFSLLCITPFFPTMAQEHLFRLPYKAAGILPYAVHQNKLLILLGKEASGNSANTWSDFGGRKETSDHNNPLRTAAREFREETREACLLPKKTERIIRSFNQSPIPYADYIMHIAQIPYQAPEKIVLSTRGDKEKKEFKWITLAQLKQLMHHPDPAFRLRPSFIKTLNTKENGMDALDFFAQLEKKQSEELPRPAD